MGYQEGIGMWPSRETAAFVYDIANWGLIAGLVVGVVSTVLIVWMGNIKEEYLRRDLGRLGVETARQQERAAIAESGLVELHERMKPRTLLPAQRTKLLELLRAEMNAVRADREAAKVLIVIYPIGDSEATDFATMLTGVIREAGWTDGLTPVTFESHTTGLAIQVRNRETAPAQAFALDKALTAIGLEVKRQIGSKDQENLAHLIVGSKY